VLHFSVQRFIFDFENMTRKKSKADVQFPSVIDMGRWIGEGDEGSRQHDISSEQNVYELRGVLLHKGASAYHGHYEAQVYSSEWVISSFLRSLKLMNFTKRAQVVSV
ncbi:hypothetical protein FRC16_004706, partial [Serendipita sp. 398]